VEGNKSLQKAILETPASGKAPRGTADKIEPKGPTKVPFDRHFAEDDKLSEKTKATITLMSKPQSTKPSTKSP
jgi:hypothetical protein